MKWISFFVIAIILTSCNNAIKKPKINDNEGSLTQKNGDKFSDDSKVKVKIPKAYAENLHFEDKQSMLLEANKFNSEIFIELKYVTKDNFMKRKLYDTIKTAYLQFEVAKRLSDAQKRLTQINPNYHLLVYDALRPLSVQWEMWNALDSIPPAERGKFVSNPRNGSVHNYGAAVDITICDASGKPLDMGAKYDEIGKIAYPSLEAQFLKSGELTKKQIENRKLLRSVLQSQGFRNIPSEWWHFNAFSREECKRRFKVVEREISE